MNQKDTIDERRRLVAQSLQVGNPGNNARDLPSPVDPYAEQQIELPIDEIRPYEHNPRRSKNLKFDDIKESIRTSGLRSPLTVTRRPHESHFIVEAGGNTRLLALQQLWAETRDPRFRKLGVLLRPWRSENHVLAAHLIENEQRGEMNFWDKASGVVALKGRLEAEQGRPLALRGLEDALHGAGLAVNTATLGLYIFATERLRTLGEAVTDLAGLDVKTLQPRLNAIKRYAMLRQSLAEDVLYATVFEPVFRRIAEEFPHTGEFSAAATCEACEAAMAAHLGETVAALRDGLRQAARGGTGESVAKPGDDNDRAAIEILAPVLRPEPAPPAFDSLIGYVRAFAGIAGLDDCVVPAPTSAAGFQLCAMADADAAPPARQRAWWLLAAITGYSEVEPIAPLPIDQALLAWLANPADASSTAFWALLTCLRRTNEHRESTATHGEQ